MIGADIQLDIDDDGYADLRANKALTALVDGSGAEYCAIDAREETPSSIFWFLPTDCTASLGWFQLGLIVRESSNLEQMAFESEDTIWLEGLNSACYLTS